MEKSILRKKRGRLSSVGPSFNLMKFKMRKNVTAVIVTFNRRILLERCVKAILAQSYQVDQILIVNNASSDGTESYIKEQFSDQLNKIHIINLKTNCGGAGGFYEGMKACLNRDECVWLMDDDGYPEPTCLEKLMQTITDNNFFIGPLVVSEKKNDELAFSIRLPNSLDVVHSVKSISHESIEDVVCPFNGVLIHTDTIKKIGLPRREFFIWGDEIEYLKRAIQYEIPVRTIVSARFFHPKSANPTAMFFNKLYFNDTESELKLYCMCRNSYVNWRSYKGIVFSILYALKVIWFYSITKPSIKKLSVGLNGIYAGMRGNFSGHYKYM